MLRLFRVLTFSLTTAGEMWLGDARSTAIREKMAVHVIKLSAWTDSQQQ